MLSGFPMLTGRPPRPSLIPKSRTIPMQSAQNGVYPLPTYSNHMIPTLNIPPLTHQSRVDLNCSCAKSEAIVLTLYRARCRLAMLGF
uniref:Ovule protein n=1 Tax=Panagrellus redivivus TaxID=6233 RepID=A0A7E4UQ84_PANRE